MEIDGPYIERTDGGSRVDEVPDAGYYSEDIGRGRELGYSAEAGGVGEGVEDGWQ